jgi:hypothetical protein
MSFYHNHNYLHKVNTSQQKNRSVAYDMQSNRNSLPSINQNKSHIYNEENLDPVTVAKINRKVEIYKQLHSLKPTDESRLDAETLAFIEKAVKSVEINMAREHMRKLNERASFLPISRSNKALNMSSKNNKVISLTNKHKEMQQKKEISSNNPVGNKSNCVKEEKQKTPDLVCVYNSKSIDSEPEKTSIAYNEPAHNYSSVLAYKDLF